jgi:hypothetical protein
MFLARPLPDDLLHLLVEGEWVLAAQPRADDAGGASTPTRHRFDEGMDVWITRDTGVACAPLEAVAKNLERREATVERSNVGGYHSHTDLFDAFPRATHAARCAAEHAAAAMGADVSAQMPATSVSVEGGARLLVKGGGNYQLTVRAGGGGLELAGAARAHDVDASSVEAWVNVSRAGHFNALHDHAGAAVSGVLFVRAPPAPPGVEFSGCLFLALRFPLGGAPGAYALLAPTDRALVAFPGRLAHAVLPLAPEALRDPDDVRISLAFNYP